MSPSLSIWYVKVRRRERGREEKWECPGGDGRIKTKREEKKTKGGAQEIDAVWKIKQ